MERRIGALTGEWDALAERVGASPFARPGWIDAWWRAFGGGRLEIRTLRRDGRLAAVLPLVRRRASLRSATNCHSPASALLAEDPSAASALGRALFAGGVRRVSLLAVEPTVATAAWRAAAEEAGYRLLARTHQRSPYLPIAGSWTGYVAGLSRNLTADLRRSRRRLERRGAVSVEVATGRRRLGELLAEAFAVEASGWKGRRGTAILSSAATQRFYSEVARWAAARGLLRLFFLRLDGRAVAMIYALEQGGVCHLLKGGYDPAFRRESPGKLLLHAVVERGFARGLERVDFHGDADDYKLRWATAVAERLRFDAFAPSPVARISWAALTLGRPALRCLRDRLTAARPRLEPGPVRSPRPDPGCSLS